MPTEGINEGAAAQAGGQAEVRWGVYQDEDNYVGRNVGQIREELGGIWGIPADAQVYVSDQQVDNNYTIKNGDTVEFIRRSGEKG